MTMWQKRHAHPDPRWLTTQQDFYEADQTRYYNYGTNITIEVKGRGTNRPNPDAQIDEIRAQLFDRSR